MEKATLVRFPVMMKEYALRIWFKMNEEGLDGEQHS
jgi:hypothetical protein